MTTQRERSEAARLLGAKGARKGGQATSAAKAAAARANGRLGGRPPSTCWSCGRNDVARRPGRAKQFYPHKCPHGIACVAGDRLMGLTGMNGPARGGRCYCPACVAAYNQRLSRACPSYDPKDEARGGHHCSRCPKE